MLTQAEANELIEVLKKMQCKKYLIKFPNPTEYSKIEAVSVKSSKDKFIFDINRKGQYNINKCTYQTRYKKSVRLLRLDLEGPPHDNPDGTTVECPHIHIYREGYDLSWAFPLPDIIDTNSEDLIQTLVDFLEYNKVQLSNYSFEEGGLV
ncbi:DUF6978 family protein [Salipaludibacillus sp. HK11]|uniref:DUF6978 family protein n=1 Tax=Salipaludibacillus sp. HK11 TaxID=3394320 RepID=UPI0039FBCB44